MRLQYRLPNGRWAKAGTPGAEPVVTFPRPKSAASPAKKTPAKLVEQPKVYYKQEVRWYSKRLRVFVSAESARGDGDVRPVVITRRVKSPGAKGVYYEKPPITGGYTDVNKWGGMMDVLLRGSLLEAANKASFDMDAKGYRFFRVVVEYPPGLGDMDAYEFMESDAEYPDPEGGAIPSWPIYYPQDVYLVAKSIVGYLEKYDAEYESLRVRVFGSVELPSYWKEDKRKT